MRFTPWSEREAARRNMSIAEINNDQAGMHRLFLNRSTQRFQQTVDGLSSFFLNLFPCAGPAKTVRLHSRSRTDPYRLCHERIYEPLPDIHVFNDKLEFLNSEGDVQRPVLIHANGLHYRMTTNRSYSPFAPMLHRLRSMRHHLLQYPVLLIDSVFDGTCALSTIGDMLSRSFEMRNNKNFWTEPKNMRAQWTKG